MKFCAVLRIRIMDPVSFSPLDPGSEMKKIRIWNEKHSESRSGINIPDPPHWFWGFLLNTVIWIWKSVSGWGLRMLTVLITDQLNRNPDPQHCFKVPFSVQIISFKAIDEKRALRDENWALYEENFELKSKLKAAQASCSSPKYCRSAASHSETDQRW